MEQCSELRKCWRKAGSRCRRQLLPLQVGRVVTAAVSTAAITFCNSMVPTWPVITRWPLAAAMTGLASSAMTDSIATRPSVSARNRRSISIAMPA